MSRVYRRKSPAEGNASPPSRRQQNYRSANHKLRQSRVIAAVYHVVMNALPLYPSATSSASMMVKPNPKNSVPRLECSPADASGISSSTTT